MIRYYFNRSIILLVLLWSLAACSQTDTSLAKAKQLLNSGKPVSDILTNFGFDSVRPVTEFRNLVKQHATSNTVRMVADKEPGAKITVRGTIYNKQNQPLSNMLIYVYQTDTRGWYGSDRVHFQMNEGDRRHARLFAYLLTNADGKFEINTIQPHGYPQSDLPAHIHFEVFSGKGEALEITELLFDDDERLQGEIRNRSEREGFIISKPLVAGNKKIYNYTISISH